MSTSPVRPIERRHSLARGWRWVAAALAAFAGLGAALPAGAQDASNGRTLYFASLVPGNLSCAASSCHSADPSRNWHLLFNGANRPNVIAAAINNVPQMNFLTGRLNNSQLADLAAYIGNPASAGPLPRVEVSTTTLDFGSINLGTTSELRLIAIRNVGTAPLSVSNISINNPEFTWPTLGNCAIYSVIPVNGSCTLALDFTPTDVGTRTAILTITHNAQVAATNVKLTGIGLMAPDAMLKSMIEYYHVGLDYYFMTSRDSDIKLLDTRPEWTRTGQSFKVLRLPMVGTTGVMRFYFDRIARNFTRGTHFYAVEDPEKEGLLALNPINAQLPGLPYYEGIDSYAFAPLVSGIGGSCADGQKPVYRVFRGHVNFPDDPNHRFVTDINLYNAHVAQGWDPEGVKMCIPAE